MKNKWILGTRPSKLARIQAQYVKNLIQDKFPDFNVHLALIKTAGDRRITQWNNGGVKGLFTKEIDDALLRGEIDLAVHSLKDLPSQSISGLSLGAVPFREDPSDVLVSKEQVRFENLPEGSIVGTSSLRRKAQALGLRSDVRVEDMRGNVTTRLRKVLEGSFDAAILAKAGMIRLGLEEYITEEFSQKDMLSAVGQGAIGIEIKEGDNEAQDLMNWVNNPNLLIACRAERAFLKALGGDCRIPIGGYAEIGGDTIVLEGGVFEVDGARSIRDQIEGKFDECERLGADLANRLLSRGAEEILAEFKKEK